jgi:predicted GH43/DUF377 family glycosyl hydrolase
MVFRAVGIDWKSRLGLAWSSDGERFTIQPTAVLAPHDRTDCEGVEDPRIVRTNGQFIVTYTAFDGKCARQSLALGESLFDLHGVGQMLPQWHRTASRAAGAGCNWSKAGAMFPDMVAGRFAMLFGDEEIRMATAASLAGSWQVADVATLRPRPGMFDGGYLEMGPPPIRVPGGWLVLYHGVQRTQDSPGDARVYRLGAALLHPSDPRQVIWRCNSPLLEPIPSEQNGILDVVANGGPRGLREIASPEVRRRTADRSLPSAVFCCGALLRGKDVWIYYATGDRVINLATIKLNDIFCY